MKQAIQTLSVTTLPARRIGRKKRSLPRTSAKKNWWKRVLAWLSTQKLSRPTRQLRVRETVSLGEKRFAAVLEYGGQRFLLGGAAQSVQLLTELRSPTFSNTLASQQALTPEAK